MKPLAQMFAAISVLTVTATEAPAEVRHVVELFTSQGCSSCPPADRLLLDMAGRPDVLALAFHVDYWDQLGWKDTLGSPDNTARQYAYAAARGDRNIYTPQAVVDGRGHAVGSDRGAIWGLAGPALAAAVTIAGDTVNVGAGQGPATVWRVDLRKTTSVPIRRGENGGKTVAYVNAVLGMKRLGEWTGAAAAFDLGRCGEAPGADGCAIIVQAREHGAIIGAAKP